MRVQIRLSGRMKMNLNESQAREAESTRVQERVRARMSTGALTFTGTSMFMV